MENDNKEELQTNETLEGTYIPPLPAQNEPSLRRRTRVKKKYVLIGSGTIFMIALVVIIILALTSKSSKNASKTPSAAEAAQTQALDQKTLDKLNTQSSNNNQGQLTIASNALFKSSLEVQGPLKADKDVSIGGNVNVAGTTTMQGAVGINSSLAVRGALSVGGPLNAPTLNVGSLVVSNMNISGNFNFGGHISPSGASPSGRPSVAAGGGSVSVSGNDTSGTLIINVGAAAGPGEMAIVTFHSPFAITPHVQLTPANGASATLQYFVTRSSGEFSVETGTRTTPGTTYVYDYLVTQ